MQDIILSTKFYRWLFLLICLSSWKKLADSKEVRIICYYTNWSVYRPGEAKFSPQNINPYLCTHLVYAFGGFTKENTLKPFDKYQDIEKGGYAKFTGLKTYNKNLKTLIAIGGWNEGSSRFSPMVASAERRKELVKNTVKFLRQNHFDGLDLDWEYPTFRDGGKSRDRDNYAQLVKELREEFDRESEKTGRSRLLLTMAVPAGIEYINKGYDVPKLMKYLDWMNILSYDYHSAFEPAVNHHAPLYPLEEESEYNYDTELNIDYTIKHYLENGAIPDKLVLGIPTYGRSYTLFNPEANEMGAPADGPGDMGEATRENGYLAYYEICDCVKNQNWEEVQPNEDAMGPYAFKDNQWVGYDDENIVRKKSEYVAKNDLGGIMFWSIDNDDFRGNCHGRPYPLIEAAKEALLNAYGMTDENLIAPPSKPLKTKSKSRTRTQKTTTTTEASEESVATKSSSRRRRIKTKEKEVDKIVSASSPKRRKTETSSYSSLRVTTPTWTTPAPPATPDMGGAFKCEEEGFFPHPKDCKKYFWCLAGAGDSGIVAHQFTCPAGLYFNKAADSCDYTQNVLCNKKLQKTTTAAKTTTTEGSSSSSSTTSTTSRSPILSGLFSTTRVPPKTPVTSRTTFVGSNTAAAEEEYDDEEYEDEEESDKKSSEEDPQVIKELIELIRKAGGIDQLEKHLKIGGSEGVIKPDSTTQPGLSKSLYERVLSKTSQSTLNALRKNTGTIRNSAGPQNEGLGTNKEKLSASDKGRIQYQNIARKRPTTEKFIDEEVKNEYVSQAEKEKSIPNRAFRPKNSLEYVNIRRPKSGPSTTEANEEDEDSEFTRNKILGESSNEQTDDTSEEKSHETNRKSNSVPKYVNIRRQRPSTTESSVIEEKEASTTSKYVSIRRSTTPSSAGEKDEQELSEKSTRETTTKSGDELFKTTRYQTISRTSTTSSINEANRDLEEAKRSTSKPVIEENSDSKYQVIDISTTASLDASLGSEKYDIVEQNIITKLDDESISLSSTEEEPITTIAQKKSQNNLESSSESVKGRKRPSLFRPRPFSVGTSSSTTEPAVETTKKESIATQRPLFLVGARRRNSTLYFTSTTPTTLLETTRTTKIQSNAAANVENSNNFKNPRISLRKPIKNTFLYSSRTTESSVVSSTTARPASTRVTKYYSRRKVNSSRTTKPVESQVSTITTSSPRVNSRFRFVSRKPTFIRTRPQKKVNESLHLNPDQNIESSNQQSLEEEIRNGLETSDLTDAVNALQKIKNASTPIPKRPQKIRTTIMHTSNFSTSEKIKQATLKPTKVSQEELTLQNNSDKETKDGYSKVTDTPTTNKIEISTFRRTLKPKLTFKQTPAYQEVLNSQEDERQSNTKRKTKTSQISLSNKQPAFKETTNFNLKESKPPLRYKEPAGEQEFTNFNIKEPRPEYFIENTGFSKSSTPKSNLIFNEVPIIIPVISSSYLKKSHLQNNNDFNILYQNTNLDPFKRFEDFSPTTISQNQRETYGDSNFKEFSLNIPIVAPSSKGYFRSTTSKSLSRVATSRVPFRSSTAKPIEIEYSEDSMTAAPVVGASERPITEEFLKKYSVPYVKPNKSRFTTQQPFVIVTPTLRKDRIQRKKERPIQAFEKLSQSAESNTYKSLSEYDYYDDLEASIFGRIPEHSKVLLHTNGGIECLDQGNFPHPVSCKKFIQCAKMENGKVYGWEYTCPKNLSFDPIGGMCNWSAGLGCNE